MTRTAVGLAAAAAGLVAGFWGGWQVHDAWRDLSPRHREVSREEAPPRAAPTIAAPEPGLPPPGPIVERTAQPASEAPSDGSSGALSDASSGASAEAEARFADANEVLTADEALRDLRGRNLLVPVSGVGTADLVPSFDQRRGNDRRHEALDIMAPRGTAVLAVEDGTVARLFTSEAGGLTVYQFDPSTRYAYYYAHLDRYAAGLAEGQPVRRGQLIGYVGSTGNASPSAPHLHFGIFLLTPERRWWQGSPLDPYVVWR